MDEHFGADERLVIGSAHVGTLPYHISTVRALKNDWRVSNLGTDCDGAIGTAET